MPHHQNNLEKHECPVNVFHLHDAGDERYRIRHHDPLLIFGEAFKPRDVGRWTLVWDQPGDHRADHQTQDGKGSCGGGGAQVRQLFWGGRSSYFNTYPLRCVSRCPGRSKWPPERRRRKGHTREVERPADSRPNLRRTNMQCYEPRPSFFHT